MRNECTWSLVNRFVSFAIKLSIASTCCITKHYVINKKEKCWSWTNNINVIRCKQQSTCNNVNMARWRDASSRVFMQKNSTFFKKSFKLSEASAWCIPISMSASLEESRRGSSKESCEIGMFTTCYACTTLQSQTNGKLWFINPKRSPVRTTCTNLK